MQGESQIDDTAYAKGLKKKEKHVSLKALQFLWMAEKKE